MPPRRHTLGVLGRRPRRAPNSWLESCRAFPTIVGLAGFEMSTSVRLLPLPSSLLDMFKFRFLLTTNASVPEIVTLEPFSSASVGGVEPTTVGAFGLLMSTAVSSPGQ